MGDSGSGSILDKAVFLISLDVELAWGFISNPQHKVLTLLRNDPQQGRGAIDWLLRLFEKYQVPATWAVVGHLFLDSNEQKEMIHPEIPQFKEGWLDWNHYSSIRDTPLYQGQDIVLKIQSSPVKHEIGLHSFFHIPFSCSREVAKAEVEAGVIAAQKLGITLRSFVFPENKIGHVDVLKDNGFQIFRGKTGRWGESQNLLVRKMNSAICWVAAPPVFPQDEDGIWEIPSSMAFHRPLIPLNILLRQAIHSKKVFHISLHPWNLLLDKSLAKDLEGFLALVATKRDEEQIQVMTMGELALLLGQRGKNYA